VEYFAAKHVSLNSEESYESEILTKDLTVVPVMIRGKSMFYKGEISRITSVRNISAQKRAEQERQNLRAQLLQSQKMATMGTLAAGIAHDFNNMLTVIMGFSSFLLADKHQGDPGYDLRGIKESPPYLHDGRLLTLEDTVEFFNMIQQLKLTLQEKKDLVEFMRAL
jgi:signal transduction histidine kinase